METTGDAVKVAESYYDSSDADEFYFRVWGGEDIHVGLYDDPSGSIPEASRKTVAELARRIKGLGPDSRVLDLGAGYGGAARYLTREYGCRVTCVNLSEAQNARNREITAKAGLSDRIEVVHGNFEELPFDDGSYDVVWSQDSFLHSPRRERAMAESRRMLGPGGQLIFTDPMQSEGAPREALQPVLDRIHLSSLGSIPFYREQARQLGLEEVAIVEMTQHLVTHYGRVRAELESRVDELTQYVSREYVRRMLQGLGHWVDAGKRGHLAWGILHFAVPDA